PAAPMCMGGDDHDPPHLPPRPPHPRGRRQGPARPRPHHRARRAAADRTQRPAASHPRRTWHRNPVAPAGQSPQRHRPAAAAGGDCSMTWILTHSGYKFDLLNPTAAMVHPADIVHALSMICRFNGHCRRHYSVAQHSLTVVAILALEDRPDDEKLAGLLHDAPEAYISDLTRPLKQAMRGFSTARQRTWMMQADAM